MSESRFGKYFLLRKIASGGMGEVLLARQQGPEGFEKILVIKRILSHHTDNQDYVDMFFAEARLAAKMSHSNIVQIYEMGEIDGAFYIAMEFVNGKSIKDIIDASKAKGIAIPPAHTADIVARLCAGLGYAHQLTDMSGSPLNIIHRDVNPHNVLVSYGGEAKIIDFGIAKSEMNEHKTETGTIKGKFVYMSPEQSAAEKIDQRSDIFSIGIVLYEMLSGENPFQKANIVLSLDAIQRFAPPPPSTINPDFAPFDPIIEKALAKKANDRYADCAEMEQDLRRAILVGDIAKPPQNLQQFMQLLFKEQIEKEQKFIQETGKGQALQQDETMARVQRPTSGAFKADQYAAPGITPRPTPLPIHQTGSRSGSAIVRKKKRRLALSIVSVILVAASVSVALILLNSPPKTPSTSVQVLEPQAAVQPLAPKPVTTTVAVPVVTPPPPQNLPPPTVVQTPQPTTVQPTTVQPTTVQPTTVQPTTVQPQKPIARDRRGRLLEAKTRREPEQSPAVVIVNTTPKIEPQKNDVPPVTITNTGGAGGYFLINSNPQASVFRDGHQVGSGMGVKVEVRGGSGVIKVGDGGSPFQLTFRYHISGPNNIELNVESEPWAVLKKNGIAIGKTPRPGLAGDAHPMRFEFSSPNVPAPMSVVLRYFPS